MRWCTGILGFIFLQRQFREQSRERKRAVYAELMWTMQDYTMVVNGVLMRPFDLALRANIPEFLTTNTFPEITDAVTKVNARAVATSFIAPNSVVGEVVRYTATVLDWQGYIAEMATKLPAATDRETARLMVVDRAWGHGPEFLRMVAVLRRDAGAWET